MQELKKYSDEELGHLAFEMTMRGNLNAACRIDEFRKYYNKRVKVVKGRKVPRGTEGVCFWMGSTCYSPYGDPWGIYTSVRIGIKTEEGDVYWTALDNVERID